MRRSNFEGGASGLVRSATTACGAGALSRLVGGVTGEGDKVEFRMGRPDVSDLPAPLWRFC
jgi:hypothetical protein